MAERLDRSARLEVVGHSGKADQILEDVHKLEPELILMEIKRTDGMGLEIIRKLHNLPKAPSIAVLTSYPSQWEQDASMRAGADMYLLKDIDSDELIDRITQLIEGR